MSMRMQFVLRDAAIFAIAGVLWWAFAARSAGDDWGADLAGWVAGIPLFACAYLAHEWSHYLGALAMGARVDIGENLASGFLFSFGAEGNSLAQFVVMSLAGFAATALAIWFFYAGLPDAWFASRVARGGVLFLAVLGFTLELPLLVYGLATRSVPAQAAV